MGYQNQDRHLTVVFEDLSPEEVSALTYHPKCRAASWSHVMHERDILQFRITKLLNENSKLDD